MCENMENINKSIEDTIVEFKEIIQMTKQDNIRSITLVWHFLQQSKENIIVKSKREKQGIAKLIDNTKNNIDEIRNKYEKGKSFEAKKSILCNWCYYWEECPKQQGANPYIGQ